MDWADGVENWATSEYGNAERIEYQTTVPTLQCDEMVSENQSWLKKIAAPNNCNGQVVTRVHPAYPHCIHNTRRAECDRGGKG